LYLEILINKKNIGLKKVLLFSAIVAGLGCTSCSKSTCECTYGGTTISIEESDAKEAGFEGDFSDACKADEDCKLV
jgi:hypothetical protein